MALLVFLTFLTLFTNSYVPIWMVDNERSHMNTVINQFGEMKSKIDMLALGASLSDSSSINMYQPIDLGADGVPVFASPTAGVLNFAPYSGTDSYLRVRFNYTLGAGLIAYDDIGGGMVQLYAPNRYYVQQWVTYENGAIIIRQEDGQAMRAYPSLELLKPSIGSNVNLSFTQVDFIGRNSSSAGTGNVGMNIDLVYLDSQMYTNGALLDGSKIPVVFVFHTLNGHAWHKYLRQYLEAPGNNLVNNTDYVLSHSTDYQTVTLKVLNVSYFTFNRAITQLTIQVS